MARKFAIGARVRVIRTIGKYKSYTAYLIGRVGKVVGYYSPHKHPYKVVIRGEGHVMFAAGELEAA